MSMKTASIVAIALVGAALLFAWIYWTYSDGQSALELTNQASTNEMVVMPKEEPVTPDTAVDDLIDQATADRDDLMAEDAAELKELEEGNSLVNELNNVYVENE